MQLGKIALPPKERVALDAVVDAWEALPGGRGHSPRAIETWMRDHLAPAIRNARVVLGRKAPNEN